ncbi:lipid-A-disaccharide synthase [Hyphomonas johnsonii]|uniref:Lipid-A-disaccharide synthase n=1 Tax=Hyphomonas johnsonii MHS-2 TaxID=1280950 RepID=A0A059FV96_9PROT|nr:lipid-A-disaccharide synthase [Hyphomonas johnsonii]KCZ94383.1 lipid-A-disaccharide synthase [Hyphomonas johnsonii MHS-2]
MSAPRLYFVAAEASGDLLAREVIEAVRARVADVHIAGIGGAEMASIGIQSPIDVSALSVLGLLEGLKVYATAVRLADAAADAIIADAPDVVVLVDSWGFMLRVAQRVRARAPGIRLVKLIGPQVWATRPGRAKTLAATVDHLLCMHEIEVPYYEPHGLKTTVVGNPALSRHEWGDGAAFRKAHGISEAAQLVLVLPGSRPSEIKRVAPALVGAARIIKDSDPDRQVVIAPAAGVAAQFSEAFPDVSEWATVTVNPGERYDAMAAADLALACSGTVTSELAMQGTPMIVAYRTGWVTWALARGLLYQKTHITLLNIVSDDTEIVPEFVQTKQTPDLIAARALNWLTDPAALAEQRAAQQIALSRMREGDHDAADIAARVVLEEARA